LKNKDTKLRVITSFIVAPFAVLGFVNFYALIALVSAVTMITSYEYIKFSMQESDHPILKLVIPLIITITSLSYGFLLEKTAFIKEVDFRPESVFVLSFIGISIAIIVSLKDFNSALPFILNSTLALFWIGFNLSFFYQIYLSFGGAVALLVLTCVWFFDIGAFVVGMKFGKIRISPHYSPKKSLEGVFGGIGFTIAYIFLFELGASLINIFNNPDGSPRAFFDFFTLIIMGLVIAFFGTFGDIFESALKRSKHVKDSGNIMPGHGGLLDRIDGVLFVAPVLYIFLLILT